MTDDSLYGTEIILNEGVKFVGTFDTPEEKERFNAHIESCQWLFKLWAEAIEKDSKKKCK